MSTSEYRHAGRKFFPSVIYELICAKVAEGRSIVEICEDPSMPSKSAVYSAFTEDPLLSAKYAAAVRVAVERRAKKVD